MDLPNYELTSSPLSKAIIGLRSAKYVLSVVETAIITLANASVRSNPQIQSQIKTEVQAEPSTILQGPGPGLQPFRGPTNAHFAPPSVSFSLPLTAPTPISAPAITFPSAATAPSTKPPKQKQPKAKKIKKVPPPVATAEQKAAAKRAKNLKRRDKRRQKRIDDGLVPGMQLGEGSNVGVEQMRLPVFGIGRFGGAYSGTAANTEPLRFNRMEMDREMEMEMEGGDADQGGGDEERHDEDWPNGQGGLFGKGNQGGQGRPGDQSGQNSQGGLANGNVERFWNEMARDIKEEESDENHQNHMQIAHGPARSSEWFNPAAATGFSSYFNTMRDAGLTFYNDPYVAAYPTLQNSGMSFYSPDAQIPPFPIMPQHLVRCDSTQYGPVIEQEYYEPCYSGPSFISAGTEWERAGHIYSSVDDHDIHSVADTNQSRDGNEITDVEEGEIFEDADCVLTRIDAAIASARPPIHHIQEKRKPLSSVTSQSINMNINQPTQAIIPAINRGNRFSYNDGEIVGATAPEVNAGSKGRAMMMKMGWSVGMGLGAENKGILTPLKPVVKTTRKGLR